MISHLPVRPRHCDAQAMMHATRYYEFFEDAFLDWLGARGGYGRLREGGADLVVKASGCEHHSPARLGDVLAVESAPAQVGTTSLTMTFTMRREGGPVSGRAGDLVAVGTVTYVCVAGGRAAPLPEMLTTPA
ncbi:acyl-CoA thioesterase [Nonomuraea longispora]|uniref:Acyl-CoA thioesterase n=1 Tax=Nonomuraea longispora TaxID=1848320 RepID=A0A4V2XLK7_9ACTN|nr:thioesterase family protein [Nonomuraea longispora]TDC10616.1 acyl-CoA thioesterase [Nonomuraea longispora]